MRAQIGLRHLCAKVTSGGTPSRSQPEYYSAHQVGHLWIKSKELLDCSIANSEERITDSGLKNSSAKYLPASTVLVAMYGANVGRLGRLRRPATVNQAICGLIIDPTVADHRYVFYALMDTRAGLIAQAQGAAQQNLNQDKIKDFEIPCPPLIEQRRIASILSAYDDLIENNTRRIAILEEMARRIYEEWFVRFRFPGHENVRMVESELGLVPEGWQRTALSSILQIDKGLSYKGGGLTQSGVPMVNLKNILPGGGFRRDGTKLYSGTYKERHVVCAGDIVVANTDLTQAGTVVGSPALVPDLGSDTVIFSHHIYAVRLNAEWRPARIWVYWMMANESFKGFAKGHAVGTTVLGLPKEGVTNYRIALPPNSIVEKFAALVEPMHLLMDSLNRQIDNLRTTRDLLLPKLISGELDVSALPEPETVAA